MTFDPVPEQGDIAEISFDTELSEVDPGLTWSIVNGTGRFAGTTQDARWAGNKVNLPLTIDTRTSVEISGEFKVAESDGHCLVALWAHPPDDEYGSLCMYYEGTPDRGQYVIQTRWMKMPTKVIAGQLMISDFGDEAEAFHKMRMVLDRATSEVSYYVDDVELGTVLFEGTIPPIPYVAMGVETPRKGATLDIRCDNLKARSFGPQLELPVEDGVSPELASNDVKDALEAALNQKLKTNDNEEAFAQLTFDTELIETDPGLGWSIVDGTGRFAGITQDARWRGNHVVLPVTLDTRTNLEISGEFRVAESDGPCLVALWGLIDDDRVTDGPLCLYFERSGDDGHYVVQTRWMKVPSAIIGTGRMPAFGDEASVYHKMRIVLDRAASEISYYVDDAELGTVLFEGAIPPITKLQMDIEAPNPGTTLDIRYDNLRVRSFGPVQAAAPLADEWFLGSP